MSWEQRIENAKRRKTPGFTTDEYADSRLWEKCAVGEIMGWINPLNHTNHPKWCTLIRLGNQFMNAVGMNDFAACTKILKEITQIKVAS